MWTILGGLAVAGLAIGVLVGSYVIKQQTALSSHAQSSVTPAYFYNGATGTSFTYDGQYVTVHDTGGHGNNMKVIAYTGNQPYWNETYQVIGPPVVTEHVSDGTRVEVPCGNFQMDLIPQDYVVYPAPSFNGDKYGTPGDGVLLAAVNGTRECTQPTPTPKPSPTPTPPPEPSNTPTPTNTPTPSPTKTPTPTVTPTKNPSATPTPPTVCITPPAVSNLKIVCPNCAQ
jgi:hypothetical protein